ncbi:hypothetical protein O181_020093 [Austropuccinia psidii MF-1]|uniref:Uncharacterized protein n=1 Tax=Austropuccinia psidii MF-1 TaxID=1389203 RepID=A0A9Q3CAT7_9BASI|nr:hypothetical protein [Austropuccinia psidii MF-1]
MTCKWLSERQASLRFSCLLASFFSLNAEKSKPVNRRATEGNAAFIALFFSLVYSTTKSQRIAHFQALVRGLSNISELLSAFADVDIPCAARPRVAEHFFGIGLATAVSSWCQIPPYISNG